MLNIKSHQQSAPQRPIREVLNYLVVKFNAFNDSIHKCGRFFCSFKFPPNLPEIKVTPVRPFEADCEGALYTTNIRHLFTFKYLNFAASFP